MWDGKSEVLKYWKTNTSHESEKKSQDGKYEIKTVISIICLVFFSVYGL